MELQPYPLNLIKEDTENFVAKLLILEMLMQFLYKDLLIIDCVDVLNIWFAFNIWIYAGEQLS